jgi:type I site-specific restriction-modification system R (restriction) subunit
MIPIKITDHLNEYIYQEVYVQISVIKGREKTSTKIAINNYFMSKHFNDFSKGKPYTHFIEGLKDKCLEKLKNSPMRNTKSNDEVIILLQKKLNELSEDQMSNTFWEIETGEFLTIEQLRELEIARDNFISKLDISTEDKKNNAHSFILNLCKNYETLCQKKYPEAPLPLEILKSNN